MHILQKIPQIIMNLIPLPMAILQNITDAIPTEPPLSSIFILIVAFLVSLTSTLVSRKMIDVDKLRRLTRETKKYQKLRMQMLKTADTKLKLKYDRNADRMRKVQSELTMMNLKPLMIMFLPMILFFVVLSGIYNFTVENGVLTEGNIPAVIPFALPEYFPFPRFFDLGKNVKDLPGWGNVFIPNYIWWYFGGSLAFGSILRKVAGLQPD
ncbi:MAG: EMC3/TMCO1 family protein [Candidatus Hermodarchaeota archaeon]